MVISKKKALKYIQEICADIPKLKQVKEDSEEYSLWKYKTDNVIKHIFGETSSEYVSIHSCLFPKYVGVPFGMEIDYHQVYLKHLDSLYAELKGYEKVIELSDEDEPTNERDAISLLIHILSHFHTFARQLKKRYNNRRAFEIEDEYDVQDLLHAILKLHFEDVRKEEYTPSCAGSSTRVDFLLKNEKIVIEVKKTRYDLKDKELGKQLILDKEHYNVHPDCKTLVCFIYDPDGLLSNPIGLKNDLSNTNLKMETIVIISPDN